MQTIKSDNSKFVSKKFRYTLDRMARLSSNGIDKFSNATAETIEAMLFYDDISNDEKNMYRIVYDAVFDVSNLDILLYYDDACSNKYRIRAVVNENTKPYIIVQLLQSGKKIRICDGTWEFIEDM